MIDLPRHIVLAVDSRRDGLDYLRAHPDTNVAVSRADELHGLSVGKVAQTEAFTLAAVTDPEARRLRDAALSRLAHPAGKGVGAPDPNAAFGVFPPVDATHTPPAADQLVDRFRHHPPANQATIDAHQAVRASALALAQRIENVAPAGREKATALTKCEEAMMWANAAIARGGANQ